MGLLAWIFGAIAGLCVVMGIVTALELIPLLASNLTWMFWLMVSGVLFLASIVFAIGRSGYE